MRLGFTSIVELSPQVQDELGLGHRVECVTTTHDGAVLERLPRVAPLVSDQDYPIQKAIDAILTHRTRRDEKRYRGI